MIVLVSNCDSSKVSGQRGLCHQIDCQWTLAGVKVYFFLHFFKQQTIR